MREFENGAEGQMSIDSDFDDSRIKDLDTKEKFMAVFAVETVSA